MSQKIYRPCVGIALFNNIGQVFIGERIDTPGAWQMPQGGIDDGEDLTSAIFREMREEIGTQNAEIVKIIPEKIRYDLPDDLRKTLWGGRYAGQEQTWVKLKFLGADRDIDIAAHNPPEFRNWKWSDPAALVDLVVPFKRGAYRQIITLLQD